jgi:hypothetical protein
MKRPLSVWTAQVVFALFLVTMMLDLGPHLDSFLQAGLPIVILLVSFAVAAFVFHALIAVARKSPRGRWKGLVALALIFLLFLIAKISEFASPETVQLGYSNDAQGGGAVIGTIVELIGLLILFWRFGFSQRARQYFGQSGSAAGAAEPHP